MLAQCTHVPHRGLQTVCWTVLLCLQATGLGGWPSPSRCDDLVPCVRDPVPQMMDTMARGAMLADVVAIIGTLDVVFGEIDR